MRNIFNSQKTFNMRNISGLTMVELMVAVVVFALLFLPVYGFLTGATKRTDELYAESVAFTRARCIMDFLHKQLPFQALGKGNPAVIGFPKKTDSPTSEDRVNNLTEDEVKAYKSVIQTTLKELLSNDPSVTTSYPLIAEGTYTCPKGFIFQTRVSVTEQTSDGNETLFFLDIEMPGSTAQSPQNRHLIPKNSEDSYALMKKIVVQVRWSDKNRNPAEKKSRNKNLHLVAYKSNLGA